MPSIRMIATDLDGTLLNSAGKISEHSKAVLRAAVERGVYVTFSTGRMFSSASRFAGEVGIEIPLICYNGAMVRRPDGEMLSHLPLEMGLAKRVLTFFKERSIYVQSYVDDVLYVRDEKEEEFQRYIQHFGVVGYVVGDALYDPSIAPTKLLALCDTEDEAEALMYKLREEFGKEAFVTRSNPDFVEMMNPLVGKERALATLAESLGVEMSEVLAIGDGENDTGMIQSAGLGLAVANGRELPKSAAREVVPSNDEDGVAWAVEKYVLSR